MIFNNQHIDETTGDKVDSMDKCIESYLGEEPRRLSSEEPPSPVSSEQSDGTDGCIGCEEQHLTAAADNHQLKDVKIVGVHKQQMPRRSFVSFMFAECLAVLKTCTIYCQLIPD